MDNPKVDSEATSAPEVNPEEKRAEYSHNQQMRLNDALEKRQIDEHNLHQRSTKAADSRAHELHYQEKRRNDDNSRLVAAITTILESATPLLEKIVEAQVAKTSFGDKDSIKAQACALVVLAAKTEDDDRAEHLGAAATKLLAIAELK